MKTLCIVGSIDCVCGHRNPQCEESEKIPYYIYFTHHTVRDTHAARQPSAKFNYSPLTFDRRRTDDFVIVCRI